MKKDVLFGVLTLLIMLLSNISYSQEYIDYKIRTDDFYANTSYEFNQADPTWRYGLYVGASYSNSFSQWKYTNRTNEENYSGGNWYNASTNEIWNGISLHSADNIYIKLEGWEDDDTPVSTYNGNDEDYSTDYDYMTDLHGSVTRGVWTNFRNAQQSNVDYVDCGSTGGGIINDYYKVEFDVWWNWSKPVDPEFSITNITTSSLTINLTDKKNYRITDWGYQVSTNTIFTNIVASSFEIAPLTTDVTSGLNAGTTYYIRIRGENEAGIGDWASYQTITTLSEPVITNSSIANFIENGTGTIIDVESTDVDGDTEGSGLTYTFSTETGGGIDNGLFAIDTNTGVITFTASPDYENPMDDDTNSDYEIQVTVTDSDDLTALQNITITVTDAAEAPVITISSIVFDFAENDIGTVIDVQATDDDGDTEGSGLTYAFINNGGVEVDNDLFTIDTNTGVITFMASPDYENPLDNGMDNEYLLQVTVTDSDGLTALQNMTITVTDVVEMVSFTIDDILNTIVSENTIYTSVTPALSGDAPIGNLTYTLGGADAVAFSIDPSTGVVSMMERNYEAPADVNTDNVYELIITATDSDSNSDDEIWTVTVEDDYGTEVLIQIGLEGDNPDTINSIVTVDQLNTITGLTGVVVERENAYQESIDVNPDNFSSPATLAEVQAMIDMVNTTLGIKSTESVNIFMYPNPASKFIYLTFNNSVKKSQITIYNIMGKRMQHQVLSIANNRALLDVSGFTKGVYLLSIDNEFNNQTTKRLIIK